MACGGSTSIKSSNEMSEPMPLIDSDQSGNFQLNPAAVDVLSQIKGPVTVIGIVGRSRKGKSYSANWFMTKQFGSTGFALGSTVQSKTKGIWFWCRPHPFKEDGTLIVLDTEGLEDPEKGDATHDLNIFTFTVLMSSYLILNSVGNIDDHSIQILHFVTEMTERIRVKANHGVPSVEELSSIFPTFCWVLRDFFLEEEIDGRKVTPKEYMEHCLKLKEPGSGSERHVNEYNFLRKAIKQYFKKRNCFCLPRPVIEEHQLRELDSVEKKDLRPCFVEAVDELYCHVLNDAQPYIMNGTTLTGRMWLKVLESYVKAVNEGAVPVISNAFKSMAESENQRAIKEALDKHKREMESKGKKVRELEDIEKDYRQATDTAVQYLREVVIGDYGGDAQQKMEEELSKAYESFREENFTRSENECQRLLSDLYQPITNKIENDSYLVLGGYEKYKKDRADVEQKYKNQANGPAKEAVFKKQFHEERGNEAKLIMNADKKLTDADRKRCEENRRQELESAEMSRYVAELHNRRLHNEMIQQLGIGLSFESFGPDWRRDTHVSGGVQINLAPLINSIINYLRRN